MKIKSPFRKLIFIPVLIILIVCQSSDIVRKESPEKRIRLLVRADDMASFHTANLACIKVYRDGIARSVEVMVPCAWFPEAVKLLNENPGLDVGVHLILTSEWDHIKWRPVSYVPSLTDKDGYFFPFIWKNKNTTPGNTLLEAPWKLEDIEQELRAQIELARKYLPHITHVSAHMGFTDMDKSVKNLVHKLAKSYHLACEDDFKLNYFDIDNSKATTTSEKIDLLIDKIKNMEPGTWELVDHPGMETEEMKSVNNLPEFNLGRERQQITDIWTNTEVMKVLKEKGVELISYNDLIKELPNNK